MRADSRSMTDSARRALNLLTCDETADLDAKGRSGSRPRARCPGSHSATASCCGPPPSYAWWTGEASRLPGTAIFPRTTIVATAGHIDIGAQAEIGEEGGFSIKAEEGISIAIGDGVRLLGGGSLALDNWIGRGAQILGPIRCQGCRLGDGDPIGIPIPTLRGGVSKGRRRSARRQCPARARWSSSHFRCSGSGPAPAIILPPARGLADWPLCPVSRARSRPWRPDARRCASCEPRGR